ncbi:META domain-containing protein [Algibacter sp. 2305UL17-15]|uniref:META domain-containing protein n=1 Tax=Algibacter sp. 2305UL17-15 TaxID=3231268 RepID=UPI003459BE71
MKCILMLFSIIILRTCGASEHSVVTPLNNNTILKELKGTYRINTLNGQDVSSFNLNMTFNDSTKQVSGFSGCNRFFGSYVLENNTITFSNLGATKMMCTKEKNNVETNLFKAMEKSDVVLCSENGISLLNKKQVLLSASKEPEENVLSFEYSATSRGSYKHIKIDKEHIFFSKEKGQKSLKKECDTVLWNNLSKVLNLTDIETIPNLEAPSKTFQFDGAALARLKITSNGKTYESPPFDHGNPPKEIAALVKEILSITENIE